MPPVQCNTCFPRAPPLDTHTGRSSPHCSARRCPCSQASPPGRSPRCSRCSSCRQRQSSICNPPRTVRGRGFQVGGHRRRCGRVSSRISGRSTAYLCEAAQQRPTSFWFLASAPNAQLAVTGTACQQSHTLPHRRAGIFRSVIEARVAAQRLTCVQGGGAVHAVCHLWVPEGGGQQGSDGQ